jgi:arylsulfatase A-like enzyme
MLGLTHRGFALHDPRRHLAHTLGGAGYTCALAGFQHEQAGEAGWSTLGYQSFLGDSDVAEQVAASFLNDASEQPFFLTVGFSETHREFPEPHAADGRGTTKPAAPFPDTPETRTDMAAFNASARILDEKMGVVFDALERNGLRDDTLVICTTDHGIPFPGMKCSVLDGGIGVMLILRGPGGFSGGRVTDALVSQIDLYPTICALAGIEPPDWLEGESLLPLAQGERESVRDAVFVEVNYHAAYEPQRAVRTDRWKLARRYGSRTAPVLSNIDDSLTKDILLAQGWADTELPHEALYDTVLDPNESHNLIDDERYAETRDDLRARLAHWMRDTDDPLLVHGYVPPPETALLNHPDAHTPSDGVLLTPHQLPGQPDSSHRPYFFD